MSSLWPKDLMSAPLSSQPIRDILEGAAKELEKLTSGQLKGEIDSLGINDNNYFSYSFVVRPRGRTDYSLELFRIRGKSGGFPAVIENYHLDPRQTKLNSIAETEKCLQELFSADQTRSIIRLMAEEAVDDVAINADAYPYFVGPTISELEDGTKYTGIVFGEVSSWILLDQLEALAKDPEESGSAYRIWRDRIAVTVKVSDKLKLTLPKSAADWIRSQAAATLRETQKPKDD